MLKTYYPDAPFQQVKVMGLYKWGVGKCNINLIELTYTAFLNVGYVCLIGALRLCNRGHPQVQAPLWELILLNTQFHFHTISYDFLHTNVQEFYSWVFSKIFFR